MEKQPSPVKRIRLAPISSKDSAKLVKALHYSGRSPQNSQLHLGVFLDGRCGGVIALGPSIDKRRMANLVEGSDRNDFLEINRMALAEWMPRNSESRVIAMAIRYLKKHHPRIKWIVSFADGTQCGDGTIYRAAGFLLTSIKRNSTMLRMPDGSIVSDKALNNGICAGGRSGRAVAIEQGAAPLPGFQLRYVKFLDPSWRPRLKVPVLPFSAIDEAGARLYRGEKPAKGKRAESIKADAPAIQAGEGGSIPTSALHSPLASSHGPAARSAGDSAGGPA